VTTPIQALVDYTDFPNNIVMVLGEEFRKIPPLDTYPVLLRPLRPSDPSLAVAVAASLWEPEANEIGQPDPAVSRYVFALQCMVKHGDEVQGLAAHAALSKKVRDQFYRNPALRARLSVLRKVDGGVTERVQRFWIQRQQFISQELEREFLYVSALELWVETETVRT
jgi:hypothetical protein